MSSWSRGPAAPSSASHASAPASTAGGVARKTASSRCRRAESLRTMSASRLTATVSSQARGLPGRPLAGHWVAASSSAS